ncbi:class I SAM-dependent DNA methyltransferase [Streptomyces sp. BA2]|uniref:class I SAM-dependent DNA methyltransferase n=1 Tax=Streptomyces sp. BA2 TaxID=436595 RepID=UPI0013226B20|nr:class I SAM-dependent methyltransferase [Streptomyces sp. BA2]MWA08024.1 methyltransferase domain-containing protein [Streptomyces sp. BA2]
MYENNSAAEMYDLLYQDRKDYKAEAEEVAGLIREKKEDADSLLDVACGTGVHLEAFAGHFARVEGVDLSGHMLKVAAQRLPGTPLHQEDMREFELENSFDAIVCMFSSIGYLRTTQDLNAALRAFARNLSAGGVVVIEPWYFPETFLDNHVSGHALTNEGRTITRVSHSTRVGNIARMELHYVLADREGVQHRSEIDELTLFTPDDYEAAFSQAGLKVDYVEAAGGRPGYFVGTAA